VILRMGIDIAVRAPHQASLADERGELLWSGHRFRTTATDLAQLWARLPEGTDTRQITVVMEPTRNAWVPLAAWFRRQGADVVLVSAERSADLRAYYSKHTESDRLDSVLLARLPLLHPEGLHRSEGSGPVTRCAERPSSTRRWSNAAPPAWPGSTRCWRSWVRTGMQRSAPTCPTRPRCGSSPPATRTHTRSSD
jgi:hypothetical protein